MPRTGFETGITFLLMVLDPGFVRIAFYPSPVITMAELTVSYSLPTDAPKTVINDDEFGLGRVSCSSLSPIA